ncbi:integrase core domain-containing protein [Collinsella intestinalis]|uniref:integrase core domain-containing protein n=1 Tax=Collinsella intestinalis TaxID=147207 RepID=UPI0022E206A9|nr:integrase core domain-containing protein [Collinsella intestinalis]
MASRGMPRLADVDRVTGEVRRRGPATPVRYERERPGELVHGDVKKVARIPDGGGATCAAFMGRALRFFAGLGPTVERVMTDNVPGYRSGEFNALLGATGARNIYTRPYSPWQNGKMERMNRTVAQEWQYARAWGSEAERASTLPAFIERYNRERPHSACGGLPPMSRIVGVNNYRHTTAIACAKPSYRRCRYKTE